MDLEKHLAQKKKIIDRTLDKYLFPPSKYPPVIHRAMRYMVFPGGKRFRPILTLAAARVCDGKEKKVLPLAAALEMIHTYSLIHDDLPAMDNDDYRRGRLSCHKKFSEAIAVLSGDALLIRAFEVLGGILHPCTPQIIQEVCQAIGSCGMIGGQVMDIHATRASLGLVDYVYRHKTAALIKVCLRGGALLAGASSRQVLALGDYGENIGFAFQITDDILDQGKKETISYPRLRGLDRSGKEVNRLISQAKRNLRIFGTEAEIFFALADYLRTRKI